MAVSASASGSISKPYTWPNRLLVCIPLAELGYSAFHCNLSLVHGYGWYIWKGKVLYHMGGYIHGAHNNLAKEALKLPDWDRLVWLEHDHEFPADMLFRHAQYTQPIVSAIYVLRDINSPLPVFYNWDAERANALHPNSAQVKRMLDKRGLYEVDCVPMGCTSVRRDVLEQWPADQPMFNSFTNPRGSTMSDDIWFCRIAQDMGWQPYVDTSLSVKHVCQVPIDDSFFVRWWNEKGAKQAAEDVA
jgi:hypothetical protein